MQDDELHRLWGRNLRRQRLALNSVGALRRPDEPPMSQEALANLLDPPVAQSTVARWEDGSVEPRSSYKQQLAAVLHRDAAELFPLTRATA